jgi:hypothetical protein
MSGFPLYKYPNPVMIFNSPMDRRAMEYIGVQGLLDSFAKTEQAQTLEKHKSSFFTLLGTLLSPLPIEIITMLYKDYLENSIICFRCDKVSLCYFTANCAYSIFKSGCMRPDHKENSYCYECVEICGKCGENVCLNCEKGLKDAKVGKRWCKACKKEDGEERKAANLKKWEERGGNTRNMRMKKEISYK